MLEAGEGRHQRIARRPEREANVLAEARRPPRAALAGVDVEELAGDGDDLLGERGAEERHPVAEGGREVGELGPDVERAVGLAVDGHAEAARAGEEELALV